MIDWLKRYLKAAADTLMPRQCPVCGSVLAADEQHLCRRCLSALPRTYYENTPFNVMEQLFAGRVPVHRATALFYYEKEGPYTNIVHDIKYRNMASLGIYMGQLAVQLLKASSFMDGIDFVIPVPLHRDKLAQRGYNQAEMIARGIAQAANAKLYNAVIATKPHSTQTRKGAYERWINTQGTTTAANDAHTRLQGKHVLIVDDVVTTGATLVSCAQTLSDIPGITISIFTLTSARLT